jgi:hypothetical protein
VLSPCSAYIAAHTFSPETATALLHELHNSQPHLLAHLSRSVVNAVPKAYRFSGEMEEIAGFVGGPAHRPERAVYDGLARLYERVDGSVKRGGEGEVQVLKAFAEEAKKVLEEK